MGFCHERCGVTPEVFALWLSPLPTHKEWPYVPGCDRVKHKEWRYVPACDRLLMLLMKLKLGITGSSIAVLFALHRKTATRHFHNVLHTLSTATQRWIVHPSHVTMATNPGCFKIQYLDYTMIIDCTEVRTEEPSTVPQQSSIPTCLVFKLSVGITPYGSLLPLAHMGEAAMMLFGASR